MSNFFRCFCAVTIILLFRLPALAQQRPWTVSEIFGAGAVHGAPPPSDSSWSPDGSRYTYRSAKEGLISVDAKSGARSVLVPEQKLAQVSRREVNEKDKDHRGRYSQPPYLWSPDSKRLLFDEDGTLWLYTLADGSMRQVGDSGQGSGDDAKFSPDGKAISYLHGHNLFVIEPGQQPRALTHSSDPSMLNGEVDWVYLEELKVRTNYAWAPDSGHLAYVQMNEAAVPEYPLADWIPIHAAVEMQRYPQPGDRNPAVRLGVVASAGGETKWIELPVRPGDDYIPRLGWIDEHTVWAEMLTRDHQHRALYFADSSTGEVRRAYDETDAKFFNDAYDVSFYAPGAFLLTSWRDGHTHLYRYSYDAAHPLAAEARMEGELEHGNYEVGDVLSVDTAARTVYYASSEGVGSAASKGPPQQQVWAVGLDGSGKHPVTTSPGSHSAAFAAGHTSYTDTASSQTTPPEISLCTVGGGCRQIWQATVDAGHGSNPAVMLELKAADGVTTLYASLTLPRNATAAASVPLINNPYGGPGAVTVADRWSGATHSFDELLAEHGFAVLQVDNRGMGQRGRAFEQACYHDFGRVQLADQLAAIDQVLQKYPQLDPNRLGWWGWSWGGTFTLNALTHSDRFRAGVAVAPVTDMRNYDTIYTERYLGLPAENPKVYDEAAVLPTAHRLKAHLLLVHGTGDDNVHIENTIQFVQKLIDADIPYDLQLYPRKTHSIAGPEARTHLYQRIVEHFDTYLKPGVR